MTDEPSAVPDYLGPESRIVFCGINPGEWSARAKAPFANPRNDFWRLLHAAGFTPRLLAPQEAAELVPLGLGLTNAAGRTTRGSSELRKADFAGAAERLEKIVQTLAARCHRVRGQVGVRGHVRRAGRPRAAGAALSATPPSGFSRRRHPRTRRFPGRSAALVPCAARLLLRIRDQPLQRFVIGVLRSRPNANERRRCLLYRSEDARTRGREDAARFIEDVRGDNPLFGSKETQVQQNGHGDS